MSIHSSVNNTNPMSIFCCSIWQIYLINPLSNRKLQSAIQHNFVLNPLSDRHLELNPLSGIPHNIHLPVLLLLICISFLTPNPIFLLSEATRYAITMVTGLHHFPQRYLGSGHTFWGVFCLRCIFITANNSWRYV